MGRVIYKINKILATIDCKKTNTVTRNETQL